METKVQALDGNQKKLTITIDAKEVDARIKKQYKDFAYKYNFPGFRKGKAPRPVIDNVLGKEAVVATVTDDVLNSLYPQAMDAEDLIAISQPKFEDAEAMVEAGKPFSFTVTVETRPEFELSSYDQISVKLPSEEATDAEIDDQIEELRNYYYTFEDAAANTKLKEESFAELAISAKDEEGNAIESLESESRLYQLGQGLFPASFDAELVGMKKGDSKSFEIDMAAEPSMMAAGTKGKVAFEVTVNQVKKRILPEITDEWARDTAGFEGGVEELRNRVADSIKDQKSQMMPRLRENEALYAIQERLQGEAPASLCEQEEQNLLQNFFMQIQQSGMTFDAYLAQMGMTPDTFKDDLKRQAKDVTEQDLALDAWARNAKIEITDEEITAEFEKAGSDDAAALEREWREAGRIASLRAGMRRSRALDAIIEGMKVEELKPGEKLNSVAAEEAEKKAAPKAEKKAEKKAAAEEPKAEAAASDKPNKTALNKMKVAELKEMAEGMGIDVKGLKKAELVDAILAAE